MYLKEGRMMGWRNIPTIKCTILHNVRFQLYRHLVYILKFYQVKIIFSLLTPY